MNIVKCHFKIDVDEESLNYFRFVTHLKYFAKRVLNGTKIADEEEDMYELIKRKYSTFYECVTIIKSFVEKQYAFKLIRAEELYLRIRIERVRKRALD